MHASAFLFALRRLRRGWRSGELRVLALALMIAAAAASAVGLFTDRVGKALDAGSGETLGADALVLSRDPVPEALLAKFHAAGLRSATIVEFPSVVLHGDQTQLVAVKAVQPGYPLRGHLSVSQALYGPATPAQGIPAPGEVWIEPRLWTLLGLQPDGELQLGVLHFKVSRLIVDEPGRGSAFGELAPELLMNAQDLAATQLLGAGSRQQYTLQLAGDGAAIKAAESLAKDARLRFLTPRNARPELKESMKRASEFLDLAVLATLLLAAAAIALSSRLQALRLRDEVALLKCLGATRGFVARTLLSQQLLLAGAAGGAGLLLGALIQALAAGVAAPSLGVALPAPGWAPLPLALMLVVLLSVGFALPPLLDAVAVPPLRVFQRGLGSGRGMAWSLVAAGITALLLTRLQAGSVQLAGEVLAGTAMTAVVLALAAWLLVRALSPLQRRSGVAWRFGLGNIARRRGASIAQIVALGISMLALLLLTVVRDDLLSAWKNRLPADAPNQFLVNIQPGQTAAIEAFFRQRGMAQPVLSPMVRGRMTALNGKPVTVDSFSDPETRRWINREFNLSWTDRFGRDNDLVSGSWWPADTRGQPLLSIEEDSAKRLGLKIGDTMTLDIGGRSITLTVRNTRKVHWDSFKPNFFLATPPGVLEDLNAVQWITSFYLPPEDHTLLRDLVRQFPNVTLIDLGAVMQEVRSQIDRVVHAIEFILAFALGAGLVVVLAVIEGARDERTRETGLLRALGATSGTIAQGLFAEYAVLGLLAGLIASAAAQLLAWRLATHVFEIEYGLRPLLWLAGAGGGAVLVGLTGWLSLRKTLNTPPRQVLAAES